MAADASPSTVVGSLDELKRVKDVEREWDERVRDAHARADTALQHLREDADARIALARTAARQSREERVRAAQQEGDREAAQILAAGATEAEQVAAGTGSAPAEQREAILRAVLGEFLTDGSA
ncbi:MAG: hypothetical protein LVQ64_04545 [Thermoplasmatales archaeon]|nr:hypothetical protein [Thermoplasmatales archaeon]